MHRDCPIYNLQCSKRQHSWHPGPLITMTSLWAQWRLKSPASRLFTQLFIQSQIKENIKAPRHWPLGIHRWPVNSPHKGPVTRKMFLFDDVIMCWGHRYHGISWSIFNQIPWHIDNGQASDCSAEYLRGQFTQATNTADCVHTHVNMNESIKGMLAQQHWILDVTSSKGMSTGFYPI